MPLQSGRYIIVNAYSRNLAVLFDDSERSPLRSHVLGLHDGDEKGEEWSVDALGNGSYRIRNIDFRSFASSDDDPEEDEVLGKSTPYEWALRQRSSISPVYLISPYYNKDLYWGLPVVHGHGTPLILSPISTDKRNHWLFKPVGCPTRSSQQGSLLGLDSLSSTPSEEMNGGMILNSHSLFNFFRSMFTRIWQTHAQGNEAGSSSINTLAMVATSGAKCSMAVGIGSFTSLFRLFGFMRQLPYMIKIDQSVYIIDILGERITLSSEIWQNWEKVDEYLKDRQRDRAGSRYVEDGDYYIANQDNQLIVPEKWGEMIKPGMKLDMGIIFRTLSLAITRQCPRCLTLVDGVSPKDRDIQCTFCLCKFRVREETTPAVLTIKSGRQQPFNSKQETHPASPQVQGDNGGPVSIDCEVPTQPMSEEKERLLFHRIHIIQNLPDTGRVIIKHDVIVVVMGATGTGKSTFIKMITGQDVEVGHDLTSTTKEIRVFSCPHPDGSGRNLLMVDTPGYDDTIRTDADILETIATWLAATYHNKITLTGILFLHCITDNRPGWISLKNNLRMFRKLCGEETWRNVILVTTMWDMVDRALGERREKDLYEFWKPMAPQRSRIARSYHTYESAYNVLNLFHEKSLQ